jgi:hypothetical protein
MKMRIFALPIMVLMLAWACNAQVTHNAVLTWGASTTTGATYNILRGTVPGGTKTAIKTGLTVLTFTDTPLPSNTQECYQVTVSAPGFSDSAPTNEVCGTTGKDAAVGAGTLGVIFN